MLINVSFEVTGPCTTSMPVLTNTILSKSYFSQIITKDLCVIIYHIELVHTQKNGSILVKSSVQTLKCCAINLY